MYARVLVLSLITLSVARAQNASDESDDCNEEYTYSHNETTVNITQDCKEKACITKCCPDKQIYIDGDSQQCVNFTYLEETYNIKPDYSSVEIFNTDIVERDAIIAKKNISDFVILYNGLFFSDSCSESYDYYYGDSEKWYILENGSLVRRALNHANQWFKTYSTGQFCFDLQLKDENGKLLSKDPEIFIVIMQTNNNVYNVTLEGKTSIRALLSSYGLLASCVFMVLVLAVYALLAELRNLMGLMLMAYLAATTAFFLLRSVHVLAADARALSTNACTVMTLLVYYSMLSSTSWLNVMSFDIWWTLRRDMPVDASGRSGRKGRRLVPKKFWWYNVYGWGLPLILTLFVIVVDVVDLRHLPNFVKPHVINGNACFIDDEEYARYVLIPLLILMSASVILFVATVFRIWRVRRGVNAIGASSKDTGVKVYVKLSLVMGTTWIFEALSTIIANDCWVWYISDVYNIFVGFFLFIAFVCKKKVILSLCKKFSIDNAFVRKLRARDPESSFATSHAHTTHSTVCATNSVDVTIAHPAGDNGHHKKT